MALPYPQLSVEDVLQDIEALQHLDFSARSSLVMETILWGAFSFLVVVASLVWIRARPHTKYQLLMISTCIVMYAMATAHWAVVLSWLNEMSSRVQEALVNCLVNALDGKPTSCTPSSSSSHELQRLADAKLAPTCAPTVMLAVNIVLSDAIVLLRACLVCAGNRFTKYISIMLFIAISVLSGYNTLGACLVLTAPSRYLFGGAAGTSALCMSWALNVWATCMIGYKAWEHKRIIKTYLTRGRNSRTPSEKVLALFVDSGLLYCALWSVVMASALAMSTHSASWAEFISTYFTGAGLVQIIGMYPTVIVMLVSLERSQLAMAVVKVHTLTEDVSSPVDLQPPANGLENNVPTSSGHLEISTCTWTADTIYATRKSLAVVDENRATV